MGRIRGGNLHFLATALLFWTSTSLAAVVKSRLQGTIRCSGRLEVKQTEAWMSVCMDDYNLVTAQVVCKELGCGSALGIYNVSSIANKTEKMQLFCQDGETPFNQCVIKKGQCSRYSQDVAVQCSEPLLPLIILVCTGVLLLLLLLVSPALCLVYRKRQAKHRIPTRFVSRVKNEYESDKEEGEEDDYVNVEPVVAVSYVMQQTGPANQEDGDDYEELESDEDHNYEEATPREGFTRAARSGSETSSQEEDSSDDTGDYENVSKPHSETEVYIYWKQEEIYQNL